MRAAVKMITTDLAPEALSRGRSENFASSISMAAVSEIG